MNLLASNPLLALFVIMAVGLAVGTIRVAGISLGAAAAMFVALGLSTANPDIQIPPLVFQLGLALFVYAIGLNYGSSFVREFRSRGWKLTVFMLAALVALVALSWALIASLGLDPATGAGMFAGAVSSTPGMAAAVEIVGDSTPVVGYSLAYPGGVLGAILVAAIGERILRPDHTADARAEGMLFAPLVWKTVRVDRDIDGVAGDMHLITGQDVVATRVIVGPDQHHIVDPHAPVERGQVLMLNGTEEAVSAAVAFLGTEVDVELTEDAGLVFRRVTVSNPAVAGKTVADIDPLGHGFIISRLRRGDQDMVPHADMVLNFSDRVRVVCAPENIKHVRKYLGDSERALGSPDLFPLALGLSAGLLLGLVPIPLPGGSVLRLGFGGGPIVAGLIFGYLNRTGPINWQLPFHTRQTLSTLGLTLFLAGVGTSAGASFAEAITDPASLLYIGIGLLITVVAAAVVAAVGMGLFRLRFDEAIGVSAGLTTNPAVFAFVASQSGTQLPGRGYSTVYPTAIIGKIVATQVLLLLLL